MLHLCGQRWNTSEDVDIVLSKVNNKYILYYCYFIISQKLFLYHTMISEMWSGLCFADISHT